MSNTNDFLGFKIMEKLGEGAFSAAYLAVQGQRTVAIKLIEIPNPYTTRTLSKEELQSATFQENLRQTSADLNQILRTLVNVGEKKGILRYYDYHITLEPNEGIYQLGILTECLDNLNTSIGKNGMQVRQVLRMGMDLCDGLNTMLSKNICCGNLKESNIFFDRIKGYKLSDFFFNDVLIQSLRPSETYTDYGYRFLAPEAYDENAEHYDYRTDMFTLAILMYKLLNNGLLPFQADSVLLSEKEIRERFLEMKSLPVSPFIEPSLLDVLNKAAAFDPNKRYTSYSDFKVAIRDCMQQMDLLQLDRYLELALTYPAVYEEPAPVIEVSAPVPEPPKVIEEPLKPKRLAPPEGIPFTVELRPHEERRAPSRVIIGEEEDIYDAGITNRAPVTAEVLGTSEEDAILSMPTGEYVLGPHEKELLSAAHSTSPYAVTDYDYDDDIEPAYNYHDDDNNEDSSLKNRVAVVIFLLVMTVVVTACFLFFPYLQVWFKGSGSEADTSTLIHFTIDSIKKIATFL